MQSLFFIKKRPAGFKPEGLFGLYSRLFAKYSTIVHFIPYFLEKIKVQSPPETEDAVSPCIPFSFSPISSAKFC